MKATLYGINNCDTVKKAIKWLTAENINHEFYDFKKQPLTADLVQQFASLSDWSQLINKRSTTYRNLADDIKSNLSTEASDKVAFEQVLLQPTLLKRPLLLIESANVIDQQEKRKEDQQEEQQNKKLHLGFKAQDYQAIFKAAL
ncbi:MAG: arsenate reductase [Colwellia sp.]|nr:arsenate reductase [Colwellia sp.]